MPYHLWMGNIVNIATDAIVNAANTELKRTPGICEAIFAAADSAKLEEACRRHGHCPIGHSVMTPSFGLPARYIIHVAGPGWFGGAERERLLLADCYRSCLDLAAKHGLHSVAFCCISTGEFRFPNELAAQVAIQTVIQWQRENPNQIEVIFNVFKERDYDIYEKLLRADRKTQI